MYRVPRHLGKSIIRANGLNTNQSCKLFYIAERCQQKWLHSVAEWAMNASIIHFLCKVGCTFFESALQQHRALMRFYHAFALHRLDSISWLRMCSSWSVRHPTNISIFLIVMWHDSWALTTSTFDISVILGGFFIVRMTMRDKQQHLRWLSSSQRPCVSCCRNRIRFYRITL